MVCYIRPISLSHFTRSIVYILSPPLIFLGLCKVCTLLEMYDFKNILPKFGAFYKLVCNSKKNCEIVAYYLIHKKNDRKLSARIKVSTW